MITGIIALSPIVGACALLAWALRNAKPMTPTELEVSEFDVDDPGTDVDGN